MRWDRIKCFANVKCRNRYCQSIVGILSFRVTVVNVYERRCSIRFGSKSILVPSIFAYRSSLILLNSWRSKILTHTGWSDIGRMSVIFGDLHFGIGVMIEVTIGFRHPWPWPLKVHFSCRGAGNRQNYRFPSSLSFTFPKVLFRRRGAVNRQNVNVSQPKSTFYVGSQPSGRTPTGLTSL